MYESVCRKLLIIPLKGKEKTYTILMQDCTSQSNDSVCNKFGEIVFNQWNWWQNLGQCKCKKLNNIVFHNLMWLFYCSIGKPYIII